MRMDLLPCNTETILANFPPILRGNFKELFSNGKIGLLSVTMDDISFTKQYNENNTSYSYYYRLRIPYAGKRLSWEMIFDPSDMSFAPDFNFNDDGFTMSTDLDVVIESIPSLSNWNINNPTSLTSVLKEFLTLFKKQQLERLHLDNIYAQLSSEYQVLIEDVSPNDIEVYLENTCAHFLINIKVDISSLPEYLQSSENGQYNDLVNPGDDTCILKISFMKLDGSRVNTSLQLSPRLDQVLGGAKMLHIPNYSKVNSFADYVNIIEKMLQDQIKKVEEHHKLKKEFIACLCTMYANNISEFDSETFSWCELLCEVDNFGCIVRIELSGLFPDEQPTVTLHSFFCTSPKQICTEQINNYLYSPRWAPENMLKHLMTSVKEAMLSFRNHKH